MLRCSPRLKRGVQRVHSSSPRNQQASCCCGEKSDGSILTFENVKYARLFTKRAVRPAGRGAWSKIHRCDSHEFSLYKAQQIPRRPQNSLHKVLLSAKRKTKAKQNMRKLLNVRTQVRDGGFTACRCECRRLLSSLRVAGMVINQRLAPSPPKHSCDWIQNPPPPQQPPELERL